MTPRKPSVELRILLFADVLGSQDRGSDLRRIRVAANQLDKAMRKARAILKRWRQSASYDVRSFTDNVAVGWKLPDGHRTRERVVETILIQVAQYQRALVSEGIPCRGAMVLDLVAFGQDFVFGPAINRAVAAEKAAIYPRVTVEPQIMELARNASGTGLLRRDGEDVWFVDYLRGVSEESVGSLMAEHRQLVRRGLHDPRPTVASKYAWLADYHNFARRRVGLREFGLRRPPVDFSGPRLGGP